MPADTLASAHDAMASSSIARARTASGTSWLPAASSTRMRMFMHGAYMLSLDGNLTAAYNAQGTKRGAHETSLVDWEMLMVERAMRGSALQLRIMTSLEPLTIGGDGYALLLQTGGTYRHGVLRDRQHPHDALLELATNVTRPLGSAFGQALEASLYAAAVGEPAAGPVAYMHRTSAQNDPFAPLGHHWQDASHQSFGVVTAGINTRAVRLEGSVFNPRDADEQHLFVDYDGARLDAYAGRLSIAPTSHIVLSSWWAYLNAHDRLDPTTRMHRYGASLATDTHLASSARWSNTFVWAMNLHHHGAASHELIHGGPGASPHHHASSMLAESNVELGAHWALFARAERVEKNGEELGFLGGDLTALYDTRSLVLGATRSLFDVRGATFTLGARGAVNVVPESLRATYGTRVPSGFALFASVRPAR